MPAKTINLLTQKDFDQTLIGRFLRWSLTYGRYIIVCTEIVVLLAFIYRFTLDRQITDLNEEVEQKVAIIKANQEFEEQFRNLQLRTQKIGAILTDQDASVEVLQHLQTITPAGIRLTSYTFTQNAVTLNGNAATNANLALFLNQLKESPLLNQVNITTLAKKSTGSSVTVFVVEALIREPKTAAEST